MIDCYKCKKEYNPIYKLRMNDSHSEFVCRDCALKIMENNYDKRPNGIKETD